MSALCQKQTYAAQQNALFDHFVAAHGESLRKGEIRSGGLLLGLATRLVRPVALTNREKNSNRVLSSDRDTPRGRACLASVQQGHAIRGMKSVLHVRCLEANDVA